MSILLHVYIYAHLLDEGRNLLLQKPVLVEPPASFVFLSAVSVVVIVVLVVGAEFDTLMTGPLRHTSLITSRESISSCAHIGPKGKSVVFLKKEI